MADFNGVTTIRVVTREHKRCRKSVSKRQRLLGAVSVASSATEVCDGVAAESSLQLVGNVLKGKFTFEEFAFDRSTAVNKLLDHLVTQKQFSMSTIKRAVRKYQLSKPDSKVKMADEFKPSGMDVDEMFDANLYKCGDTELPPGSHNLKPERMKVYHRMWCTRCALEPEGEIAVACPFYAMLKCITHGWAMPVDEEAIKPVYYSNGNYPSMSLFEKSSNAEFDAMIASGVLRKVQEGSGPGIVSPCGAVVKNSDKIRGAVQAKIQVVDQESLTRASDWLVAHGFAKIKSRITLDATATGVNRAAYSPRFRYPSLADGTRLISRGQPQGKTDVCRFFHSFPVAAKSRHLLRVWYQGVDYEYWMCPFGFTACPYYASGWSAEMKRWFAAWGVETAHLMDDWFLVGENDGEVQRKLLKIAEILEDCGFAIQTDKNEIGMRIVYLGVLLDSEKMTLRFEAVQCKGMKIQMEHYLEVIESPRLTIDHSITRHVCGKLNWYSEIVQSGRLHIRSWWKLEKFGSELSSAAKEQLIKDTKWWIQLLESWSDNSDNGIEYKILSAETLLRDRTAMVIIQSDASGPDGFGYYYGHRGDTELPYVSKQWPVGYVKDISSHKDELYALRDFLCTTCQSREAVLVWVTDSESAMWSVNKGRCHETAGLEVLSDILERCDELRLQIVAVWVPRELNELADYLSHLATSLDRETVSGTWSASGFGADCGQV